MDTTSLLPDMTQKVELTRKNKNQSKVASEALLED